VASLPPWLIRKVHHAWTCQFPVYIRSPYESARNAQATKDALVTEVQRKIEADLTLNSLGLIIDVGNEEPALSADSNPVHRTTLRYTVEHKRKISDPP
jgi:hypothetical protein